MKWIKKTYLQCIPLCFGVCLSFYWFFWLYCITAVTPFIERSEGWSLRSVGVLDQSQQECRFFRRNSNSLQTFQLQPKRETSSSSLEDQFEIRSIISPPNRAFVQCLWPLSRLPTNLHYDNIGTYTMGASTRFFTVQEPSWSVISALAPVVLVGKHDSGHRHWRKPDVSLSLAQMAQFDGEIMDLFSSWSSREEEEVSLLGWSWKVCSGFEFRRKKRHSCCDWSRTPTDRSDQPSLRSMKGVTAVTQ